MLQDPLAPSGTYHTSSFDPQTTLDRKAPSSIDLSGFKDGDAVTYNAPAPVEAAGEQVTDNNEIDLTIDANGTKISDPTPDNFQNGDPVVYTVASDGSPIGGLTPGQTYYVITKGSDQFELSLNASPLKAITLDGTEASGADLHGTELAADPDTRRATGERPNLLRSQRRQQRLPTGAYPRWHPARAGGERHDRRNGHAWRRRTRLEFGGYRYARPVVPIESEGCQCRRDVPTDRRRRCSRTSADRGRSPGRRPG